MFIKGNKVAQKQTRKVEIGWLHQGAQMRSQTGGGMRKVYLPRESYAADIQTEALQLFFPDGKSKRGLKLYELDCHVSDFSMQEISATQSIGECYDKEKPSGILRYYLSTKFKPGAEEEHNRSTIKNTPKKKSVPKPSDVAKTSNCTFNDPHKSSHSGVHLGTCHIFHR